MTNRKNISKVLFVAIAFSVVSFVLSSCTAQQKTGCPGAITSVEVSADANS